MEEFGYPSKFYETFDRYERPVLDARAELMEKLTREYLEQAHFDSKTGKAYDETALPSMLKETGANLPTVMSKSRPGPLKWRFRKKPVILAVKKICRSEPPAPPPFWRGGHGVAATVDAPIPARRRKRDSKGTSAFGTAPRRGRPPRRREKENLFAREYK